MSEIQKKLSRPKASPRKAKNWKVWKEHPGVHEGPSLSIWFTDGAAKSFEYKMLTGASLSPELNRIQAFFGNKVVQIEGHQLKPLFQEIVRHQLSDITIEEASKPQANKPFVKEVLVGILE